MTPEEGGGALSIGEEEEEFWAPLFVLD